MAHKLQVMRDFSGGVVNQELQNRDDGRGVIINSDNVISSPNGELRKRTGTTFLASLPYKSKLVPFRLEDGNDVVFVFMQRGDGADSELGKVIGYKYSDEGLSRVYNLVSGSVPAMPAPTSWTSKVNGNWRVDSSGMTFGTGGSSNQIYNIFRDFGWNWDLLSNQPKCTPSYSGNGPYVFDIANTNTQLFMTKIKFKFGGYAPSESYYQYLLDPTIEYSDDGVTWTPCPTMFEFGQKRHKKEQALDTWIYYTNTEVIVSQNTVFSEHNYWRVSFAGKHMHPDYGDFSCSTAILSVEWNKSSGASLFEDNTNFGVNDLDSIQYAQSENNMYLTCGTNKSPMKLSYVNGVFSISDFTPTNSSTVWQTNGYPASVCVFQNRLCFAGFNVFRGRVIMSAFGDFETFTPPSPIQPTSAILADSLQLKSRIDFLWAGDKALYGLSAEGVSMIDAGGGVVATDQIEFQLRNREPAAGIQPTVKDDIMIYIGRDLKKIMITDFDFVVQRYRAVVLSTMYDNFLQNNIKYIHYIPTKARLIYGILKDGKGFTVLFDSMSNKNALYPFSVNGNMSDILPIKYGDTTKLLIVHSNNERWGILRKEPQADVELMDFMDDESKKEYTNNFLNRYVYMDLCQVYSSDTEVSWVPFNDSIFATDSIGIVADGNYFDNILPEAKQMHILQNSNYSVEYYVATLENNESVWVKNSETGIWELYGTLSVSGATMSINGIEVEDTENVLEVLGCSLFEPAKNIIVGIPYNSFAVIKLVTPYMIRKFPREIAVNFINTGYLELGNSFNDLRPFVGNLADTITLDNSKIFVNGNYEKTLDKQAFETPYVIMSSSKGLPFTITGIDYEVDYSDYQGGV